MRLWYDNTQLEAGYPAWERERELEGRISPDGGGRGGEVRVFQRGGVTLSHDACDDVTWAKPLINRQMPVKHYLQKNNVNYKTDKKSLFRGGMEVTVNVKRYQLFYHTVNENW